MTLTYENVLVLSILAVAVLLFVTEKLRSDVVALLVLLAMQISVGRLRMPEHSEIWCSGISRLQQ